MNKGNGAGFEGRWIVVSGASSGIGRAISLQLVAQGARVVLMGRNVERLNETAQLAGPACAARVRFERDAAIEKLVLGWPARFATARADALGFRADGGIEDIIGAHMQAAGCAAGATGLT